MTVFFKNEANDSILKLLGRIKIAPYAKSTNYVTKEQAAKQHTDIIGEDFMTGRKPLQNSYDIHLKADFVEKILSLELKTIANKP
jgi:cell division transport system permease protein